MLLNSDVMVLKSAIAYVVSMSIALIVLVTIMSVLYFAIVGCTSYNCVNDCSWLPLQLCEQLSMKFDVALLGIENFRIL